MNRFPASQKSTKLFSETSTKLFSDTQPIASRKVSTPIAVKLLHLPLQSVRMFPNFADDLRRRLWSSTQQMPAETQTVKDHTRSKSKVTDQRDTIARTVGKRAGFNTSLHQCEIFSLMPQPDPKQQNLQLQSWTSSERFFHLTSGLRFWGFCVLWLSASLYLFRKIFDAFTSTQNLKACQSTMKTGKSSEDVRRLSSDMLKQIQLRCRESQASKLPLRVNWLW